MKSMKAMVTAVATVFGVPASSAGEPGRRVEITVDGNGFSPAEIRVAKDEAVTLVFKRTTDATCAKTVAFPDLSLEKQLPLGEAVSIAVPSANARTLTFQCGMGMFKSRVVIQ